MKEKREHIRVPVDQPAKVISGRDEPVSASITNLSPNGAGMLYPEEAEIGTVLELHFDVLLRNKVHEIVVKGTVRHTHISDTNYYLGIEFVQLSEELVDVLARYVAYIKDQWLTLLSKRKVDI